MLTEAGSGHMGGSLGMADVFTALYFAAASIQPDNPWSPKRDFVYLSNGHICPVWYATLAERGFIRTDELLTLRKLGSRLQGHPIRHCIPGVENTSGSLGQGFSQASGHALALKQQCKPNRVFCLLGDGEMQEGSVWETLWFSAHCNLANMTVIVDRNNMQSEGSTESTLPLEPLEDKLTAFGWRVVHVNGHDLNVLKSVLSEKTDTSLIDTSLSEKPTIILAHTIPNKGVPSIEGDTTWHAKAPTKEQCAQFLQELEESYSPKEGYKLEGSND